MLDGLAFLPVVNIPEGLAYIRAELPDDLPDLAELINCSEPGMTAPTPDKRRYLFAAIVGRRHLLLQPISCRERSFQPSARL